MFTGAAEGDVEIVRQLLTKDNVDLTDERGNCMLFYAAMFNRPGAVELLIHSLANPLASNPNGMTPFHVAAENGHVELLEQLSLPLGKDFDFDTVVNDHRSCLFHSAVYGIREGNAMCFEVVRWLIHRHANPFMENTNRQTPRDILNNYDWSFAEKYDDILEELGCYSKD